MPIDVRNYTILGVPSKESNQAAHPHSLESSCGIALVPRPLQADKEDSDQTAGQLKLHRVHVIRTVAPTAGYMININVVKF